MQRFFIVAAVVFANEGLFFALSAFSFPLFQISYSEFYIQNTELLLCQSFNHVAGCAVRERNIQEI